MLEQYKLPLEIGKDALEPGLKRERIQAKARALEGLPPESDDDILRKAAEDAEQG